MFRAEVWDVQLPPPVGARPCVVLTTNVLIPRLGAITIAEITGNEGPASTHIAVGFEAGLSGRSRSWVNATGLHTVPKGKLRHLRGRLSRTELDLVVAGVRAYLELDDD